MKWDEILLKPKVWDLENLHGILWTFIKVIDESWPTFSHFSVHEWKLTKLRQYLTVFPSHFNNIFLKFNEKLCDLTIVNEILWSYWHFTKFQWYNFRLSWNFEVLCWLSVLLSVLSKDDCKISVSFKQIWNFKVSHFLMAKVEKVNTAQDKKATMYVLGKPFKAVLWCLGKFSE